MFKKTFIAATLMAFASVSFAEGDQDSGNELSSGGNTSRNPTAATWTYTVAETASDRLFVKSEFTFTVSANVVLAAEEDEDGRFMGVAATNTQGRNFFTGHSDGGSVSACGDAFTSQEAKDSNEEAYITELTNRLDIAETGACAEQDAG